MSTRRPYQSSLRLERAEETKRRIRTAARELFGEQGFAATTISAIARRAGVSVPTVYAVFESKAGIVSEMIEELELGADMERRIAGVLGQPDPRRQLRLFVAAHCALFTDGTDILRAARHALEAPEVRSLVERGDGNRRHVINELVRRWHRAGALRTGLTVSAASEGTWLLTTIESYLTAVDRLGWSPNRYQKWLGDLLEAHLLASP